jgi:hypothetical protein
MKIKPTKKARMYTKSNFRYIHGPRFVSSRKMSRIWMAGYNPKLPRYVVGKMIKTGEVEVQKMIRPIAFDERSFIKKISHLDPLTNEYILDVKISSFIKHDKKIFRYYSFAFTMAKLNKYIELVEINHNYRVIRKKMKGREWFILYIWRKK